MDSKVNHRHQTHPIARGKRKRRESPFPFSSRALELINKVGSTINLTKPNKAEEPRKTRAAGHSGTCCLHSEDTAISRATCLWAHLASRALTGMQTHQVSQSLGPRPRGKVLLAQKCHCQVWGHRDKAKPNPFFNTCQDLSPLDPVLWDPALK